MKLSIYTTLVIFVLSPALLWAAGDDKMPGLPKESVGAVERQFAQADVSTHAEASNCWIVVRNNVYDVTTYIASHPTPPEVITSYCGKDATQAFQTKDRGRPHSNYAGELLERYRVGRLGN